MGQQLLISIDTDDWQALREAIATGAFSDYARRHITLIQANPDHVGPYERQLTAIDNAASAILNAKPKDEVLRLLTGDMFPWRAMTTDEWIWASNFMVERAKRELERGHGGFMTAWYEAQLALGKAQVRADLNNQHMVRNYCGWVFFAAHLDRIAEEKKNAEK